MIDLDVALVGGGFSGCAVAVNLARYAPPNFSLAIFEPHDLGRGAAYGTRHREHVLNTRAHMMSMRSDEPDDFVRWLGERGGPQDFVSRALYGEYLNDRARAALGRSQFTHVRDRVAAIQAQGDGFILRSSSGARVRARSVVLTTGNPPPQDEHLPLAVRLHPGYVADPWRFDYRAVGGHVLVVGSGLTALDVLVALNGAGHRGQVHVLSRHGRYPEVHADVKPYDVIPALDTRDARSLLRSFRRQAADAASRGFDWRAVVDAVRPEAEAIWRRVPPAEQRRFARHARALWERYRHRAPQQVEAVRAQYERAGLLRTYAGRIAAMDRGAVTIALRGGGSLAVHPDWIVNCTGVGRTAAMAKDPLLGAMLREGIVSADPSGLGLRVGHDYTAIDSGGDRVPNLYVAGPPVRGSRFEATAVPELRRIAEQVTIELLLVRAGSHSSPRFMEAFS